MIVVQFTFFDANGQVESESESGPNPFRWLDIPVSGMAGFADSGGKLGPGYRQNSWNAWLVLPLVGMR
jgi:hypothetical protein